MSPPSKPPKRPGLYYSHSKDGSSRSASASSSASSLPSTPQQASPTTATPQTSRKSVPRQNSGSQVAVPPKPQRTRSRSIALAVSTYADQERTYLRKIRNQVVDDYYTKGISGASSELPEADDDDDDDDVSVAADLEDYPNDLTLASLQLGENGEVPSNITQLASKEGSDDPRVLERLEWQSMLTSVLTGDVVRQEKTKLTSAAWSDNPQESLVLQAYKDSLWYGVRAKLLGRSVSEHHKVIQYRRTQVDQVMSEISGFAISYDDGAPPPLDQVRRTLDRWDRCESLWRTSEEMARDKPGTRDPDFVNRVDALTSWLNITDAIGRQTNALKVWIGNDELDITKGRSRADDNLFDDESKSLAERLMKEKDVQTIFRKRIFNSITPWMIKSKDAYIRLGQYFEVMKLPDYTHDLIHVCIIPMKLIKEIIRMRLGYARKLANPTLMMIDQMIDDFKSYITIALEVKQGVEEYCKPDMARTWLLGDLFEGENSDFDFVVLGCVRYYLELLNKKLLESSRSPTNFRTFKEPEELEEAWTYLKGLGNVVEGGSVVVAQEVTVLTSKLIHRLLAYFHHQIHFPQVSKGGSKAADLIRWYGSTTENFGQLRRKLARFTGEISREYTNALVFEFASGGPMASKEFVSILKQTGHSLVFTNSVEKQGTYFFAPTELQGMDQEVLKIIAGTYVGVDPLQASNPGFNELLEMIRMEKEREDDGTLLEHSALTSHSNSVAYVLAFCPAKPIVWEGPVVNLELAESPITDVRPGQMMLISKLPYHSLQIVQERFMDTVATSMDDAIKPVEQRCSIAKVHTELTKINRSFFKMCLAVLDSVKIVRAKCNELCPGGNHQNLINNFFVYAKDFGKSSLRNLDRHRKSTVITRLIHLAIDWVSFISDDCITTDRKTFRWCVLALEFAMDITRGFNVLVLSEDTFYKLKLKVARCMSLLISHFDIMGARSSEAEKKKALKWSTQRKQLERQEDEDAIVTGYQQEVMKEVETIEEQRRVLQEKLQSVGRVLDVSDSEYQFVTLLASSFSSVSIRWQKGKFIGGGTFGNVYAAVNLDTGGVMAVKEIRFHDSQSIKNVVPSIRDEMTVLEMLNHPNVVQYFGVEVHRDKVYIFMEFCEGGSLAGLLAHGRIEDEVVVQIYTLQMLEGLAYLHHSGVVHRDIKPENVLLDHNGVVKFVDFGAAKVIANSGRTRAGTSGSGGMSRPLNSMTGTPMYMSPEVITGAMTERNGVVDIWSLGCCVLEMATGRRPWSNLDNEWAIMYHIAAGNKPPLPSPDQLSEMGRAFLARCLQSDPALRPTAVELLNDPWMVSIRQAAFGSGDAALTPSSEVGEPPLEA
ncbi:serine/threonine-protein kinase Ssk22p [Diutina catenulata]